MQWLPYQTRKNNRNKKKTNKQTKKKKKRNKQKKKQNMVGRAKPRPFYKVNVERVGCRL